MQKLDDIDLDALKPAWGDRDSAPGHSKVLALAVSLFLQVSRVCRFAAHPRVHLMRSGQLELALKRWNLYDMMSRAVEHASCIVVLMGPGFFCRTWFFPAPFPISCCPCSVSKKFGSRSRASNLRKICVLTLPEVRMARKSLIGCAQVRLEVGRSCMDRREWRISQLELSEAKCCMPTAYFEFRHWEASVWPQLRNFISTTGLPSGSGVSSLGTGLKK